MKAKTYLLILAAALASFAVGRTTAGTAQELNQQTRENLSAAMHGEAFAYAKYMLYAQHAREGGHTELANLFERNAQVERFKHFAQEAILAGLVGSDEANLRDAIAGENYETTTMYPTFARQARTAGDTNVAGHFEQIGKDEMAHRDEFQAALEKLRATHSSGK
jgi:rubrerythrin